MHRFLFYSLNFGALVFTPLGVSQAQTQVAESPKPPRSGVSSKFDFEPVRSLLREAVDAEEVAGGAVLLMQGDEIVFETGFGFADRKSKRPFKTQTPGVVASISKPLQGTVAFTLVEQGKLQIDVPIDRYLPAFADAKLTNGEGLKRAPMLKELFTHTGGTRRDDDKSGRPWFADWTKGKKLEFVVDRYAAEFPFRTQPGTSWGYSGIGTDIASRVAEVASGLPRNELLVQALCQPLGMGDTFYWDNQRTKNYKMPTRYYIGSKTGKLFVYKQRDYPEPNTYSSSGGSIVSTVHDLARWLRMVRDGGVLEGRRILQESTVEAMLRTKSNRSSNTQCGFFVRERDASGKLVRIGHTGSSGTNCWIDFEANCLGVMLTQTRGKDIKPFRIELEERLMSCLQEESASSN
ncbi:MAG: serine hydrolase domain-containing protein [Planctomycetota bacterium]